MSATVVKAEYVFYRLQKISDVATNLVTTYWAEADSDQQKYIKKALNESICVPHIDMHAEVFIEMTMMITLIQTKVPTMRMTLQVLNHIIVQI